MKKFKQCLCSSLFSKLNLAKIFPVTALTMLLMFGVIDLARGQFITGPYNTYTGPYQIKVVVKFVELDGSTWTNGVDLAARATGILETLNNEFNQHQIFFIWKGLACTPQADMQYSVLDGLTAFVPKDHDEEGALTVFDNDFGAIGGASGDVPSPTFKGNYVYVYGHDDTGPGSQSPVLIHEIGHALGLLHTFYDSRISPCKETLSGCDVLDGNCESCGDLVCDTPPYHDGSINIPVDENCHPIGDWCGMENNYMSYTTNNRCRSSFTAGQVRRMWEYLSTSPQLANVQITTTYPAQSPGAISGNIVVESGELLINSPLEMLPGSYIKVKKNAKLTIKSEISGACGQLWQGVIVESDDALSQTAQNQGQATLLGTGIIRDALVGMDALVVDGNGNGVTGTGGGIIKVLSGQLIDNVVGLRFGPSAYFFGGVVTANNSVVTAPRFSITNDYRGGHQRPIFLSADNVVRLYVRFGRFADDRTDCLDMASRAIGIDSKNAGLRINNCRFNDLGIGIRCSQLTKSKGSLTVSSSHFERCYREVISISMSEFSITGNNFTVQQPSVCSNDVAENIIGIIVRGKTDGFMLQDNDFTSTADPMDNTDNLIGIKCENTEQGKNNTIRNNRFSRLVIGNLAVGINDGEFDGLTYLCNTNSDLIGDGADFRITNDGTIKLEQNDLDLFGEKSATGNVFSDVYFRVQNLNQNREIKYHYYESDPQQDPFDTSTGQGSVGIVPEVENNKNENCNPAPNTPPCNPCDGLLDTKKHFNTNRASWLALQSALVSLTDTTQLEQTKDGIKKSRLAMNKDGANILMHYQQDTLAINVDSTLVWLANLQTYSTDFELARHYFFSGEYEAFDRIWNDMTVRHKLEDRLLGEYEHLNKIFGALREWGVAKHGFRNLPTDIIALLSTMTETCDEAGYLSQNLLWYNGVDLEMKCEEKTEERGRWSKAPYTGAAIRLYPNPANETITIECPDALHTGDLLVMDAYGRIVMATKVPAQNRFELQTGSMPSGLYYVQMRRGNTSGKQSKFTIIH